MDRTLYCGRGLTKRQLYSQETEVQRNADPTLRKCQPNTVLQNTRPEGNMQPDDESIIPQDDLYVITWETNFGEFPKSAEETTIPMSRDGLGNSNDLVNDVSAPDESFTDVELRSTGPHENDVRAPDEIFTDVDLRSTGPHENDDFASPKETRSDCINDGIDDQQSSGGSDTEVLDDENDDVIVDNESPRGGKYNLRHNPTPNFTDEYSY